MSHAYLWHNQLKQRLNRIPSSWIVMFPDLIINQKDFSSHCSMTNKSSPYG